MTRTTATNFTGPLQFPYATAGTDIFMKEDVQVLAQAVDQHNHTSGKGLALPASSITSAMIADGTIQAGDIADGAITSAKIADGTIATADLANQSVTNAKLGTDTARSSLLTNGGFEIWQRGNGPFAMPAALFGPDRWQQGLQGTDTLSVSRDTANIDAGSGASCACTFTLGSGGGLSDLIQQTNVSSDYPQLRGRTLTFSIRVRTSTANAVRIGVNNYYSSTSHWTYSNFHTGDGTWQTMTVTGPCDATATYFHPGVFFAASCTAYLDNAMLVVGSVAADYAPLHPADDLARCLRYWQRHTVSVRWWALNAGVTSFVNVPLKTMLSVNPTVTITAGSRVNIAGGYPAASTSSNESVVYSYAPTAATGNDTYAIGDVYVLEANP